MELDKVVPSSLPSYRVCPPAAGPQCTSKGEERSGMEPPRRSHQLRRQTNEWVSLADLSGRLKLQHHCYIQRCGSVSLFTGPSHEKTETEEREGAFNRCISTVASAHSSTLLPPSEVTTPACPLCPPERGDIPQGPLAFVLQWKAIQ